MAEKSAEIAESSSFFESLFGGFSNGLSIFTNNHFRRKNEATLLSEEDANGERENDEGIDGSSKNALNDEVGVSGQDVLEFTGQKKKLKKKETGSKTVVENTAGGELPEEQDKGDVSTTPVFEEKIPESSQENMKKVKRSDDEAVIEKKRRKTESVQDIAGDENMTIGSSDSRKRKSELEASGDANAEEEAAGLDRTTGTESKKKIKKGTDSEQQQGLRQSARNMKKRLNEDLLFSAGIAQKERRLEKTRAGIVEREDLGGEQGLKPTAKRGLQEADGGEEKLKKKTKRLEDIGPESHVLNKGKEKEEQAAGVPPPASTPVMETRSGSKRKKDSNVEELYESKRRGTVDGTENVKGQKDDAEQGGVAVVERLRGKRKISSEDDGENAAIGAKKNKKKTKEEHTENEERLKRTIFVGNLPVNVKPKQLLREFCQFGAVESARLRSVPLVDTKMPRKAAVITGQLNESRSSLNGYVVFHKEESARPALAHNMTEFHGKHIRVDMATAPRKGDKIGESGIEYDRSRSIFVGNLPFDVEDEEIYSLFQGKTPDLEVEAVRVVRDAQTSIGKGFAFVCFKKKVGATTALDNAEFTRLRNRQLRIIRFGFQRKQSGGYLPAKNSSGGYRSKPRSGAEERISKRSVLAYEGTRASKVDGRPGKAAGPARTSNKGKSNEKGRSSKSSKTGKNSVLRKLPAVAARKSASHGNAGALVPAGGKRKREEKGKKKKLK